MSAIVASADAIVERVFADLGLDTHRHAAGWTVSPGSPGGRPLADVAVERERLRFTARLQAPPADGWALLERNCELAGNVRHAQPAGTDSTVLVAEIDLAVGDLAAEIADVIQGLAHGTTAGITAPMNTPEPGGTASGSTGIGNGVASNSDEDAGIDLAALCRDAGWAADSAGSRTACVDVGENGAYRPCSLRVEGDEIVVTVELLRSGALSPQARAAIGALLLRVAGWVALVRPFARRAGHGVKQTGVEVAGSVDDIVVVDAADATDVAGEKTDGAEYIIGLERRVRTRPAPTPGELSDALTALALAVRYTAAEVRVLGRDDTIAALVIEWQQASSSNGVSPAGPEGLGRSAGGERTEAMTKPA